MSKRRILGFVLIGLGIICFLALTGYSVYHANYMWHLEMKAQNFDSFGAYYFSVSKGSLLFSGGVGLFFIIWGVQCLFSHRL